MAYARSSRRYLLVAVSVGVYVGSVIAATAVKPYVVAVGGEYEVRPLLSVGDVVAETSDPSRQYQMVGVPDGLGVHPNDDGTNTLFMSHEFAQSTTTEPLLGGPQYRGSFVSKWILDSDGDPVSGERAYDWVFMENTFVGPAAEVGNSTPAFGRFCSGSVAGPPQGFDRWMYFANEEDGAPITFDGKGGLSVTIFDNEAHALPRLGRFRKENTLVQPHHGQRTLIFSLEDGPATLDNQLYMYVGDKDRSPGASVLARNGLDNGNFYVFRALDAGLNSERTFTSGSVVGEWVQIPDAENLTDAQLEGASDAVNAMTFVRPEDGAFNPNNVNEFFFVTTGSSGGADEGVNELGRLYSLRLDSENPLNPATLTIVYNADTIIAEGGDIAISPDNLGTSSRYLMINEDGHAESRPVLAAKAREGSVWRFDLINNPHGVGVDVATATRVAELDPPGRDGVPVGPGIWETSGIIDTSSLFGEDTWLSDVQAHPPTAAPAPGTDQDGQLFLMRPTSGGRRSLVVNGGFESGGTGPWFSDRALTFTLDQNLQQRTGVYNAACWHPTEHSGDCAIVQNVSVPETGTYLVTIYAKADRPGAWVGANLIAQSGETQPFATPVESRSAYWGPDTLYPYFKYEAAVSAQAGDIIKVWGYSPNVPGWLVLDDVSVVKQ